MFEQDTKSVTCERCRNSVPAEVDVNWNGTLTARYAYGPAGTDWASKMICADCHLDLQRERQTRSHRPTEFKGA